jgi:tRNA threonylcarbamoyladenosine biosynthesis protein TsaE
MLIQSYHEQHAVFTLFLADEHQTQCLGRYLSQAMQAGIIIALNGPLGAGKTTLARSLLKALGVEGTIKSPSYSWVECYETPQGTINHFDFYRFKDKEDWEAYGFECYFNNTSIALIEWSENVKEYLPTIDLVLQLDYRDTGRYAALTSFTATGRLCLEKLIKAYPKPH